MATQRQIDANRRNAAKSTGPRTEAGKARSKLNALCHTLATEGWMLENSTLSIEKRLRQIQNVRVEQLVKLKFSIAASDHKGTEIAIKKIARLQRYEGRLYRHLQHKKIGRV